ncbi:hypothetical protein Tco_0214396 [Tanacetum coccineum]
MFMRFLLLKFLLEFFSMFLEHFLNVETLCKTTVSASDGGTGAFGVSIAGRGDVTSCVVLVIGDVGIGVVCCNTDEIAVTVVGCEGTVETGV